MKTPSVTSAIRLATAALSQIKPPVQTLEYDRSQVTPGILHVGVGNFFKGHQALYVDDIFVEQGPGPWGFVGAELRPSGKPKIATLKEQDNLFTVIEKDATQANPRIVGSLIDYLDYDEDHKYLKEALLNPEIKIVTMTITEGGYFMSDGKFDPQHPDIQKDAENPDRPKTLFGLLVQALQARKDSGVAPFTVMSCDNVPHNGDVVASATVGMARLWQDKDPAANNGLVEWIEEHVAFPNSMVDRIVPATTAEQKSSGTRDEYGYQDNLPVYCEPFRQWVMEDEFCNGRPDWDKLENFVEFVKDVTPWEIMKLRILNGGHASLCYPAALLGLEFVHDAVNHEVIGPFLDKLQNTEIIPSVPPVPNTDIPGYWPKTKTRFQNPILQDLIDRNCYDGASRQPKFIVPTAAQCLQDGRSADGLALVSAMWCRYCCGTTETGKTIEDADPQWDRLTKLADQAKTDPQQWLSMTDVYGALGENEQFSQAFAKALKSVHENGVTAAMQEYIDA